jgi:uncharacterized phage infection (PIP) family protein YhgE
MVVIEPTTVIGAVLNHAKTVIEYLKDIKDAKKDQNDCLNEIAALTQTLTRLQKHAGDDQWKGTMEALSQENGAFEQLTSELEKLVETLKPPTGNVAKVGNRLAWHFIKDGVKKHFDRIQRILIILHLALGNNHAYEPPVM